MNGDNPSSRWKCGAILVTLGVVVSGLALTRQSAPVANSGANANAEANAKQVFANLPVRFEANRGQTDSKVKFVSRGSRESLFLTANEVVLAVPGGLRGDGVPATETLRMGLEGASSNPRMRGEERLPTVSNYFFGSDPKSWVTKVPSYSRVRHLGAYPNIDVVYYGNKKGLLEYDFVVAPGADPSRIKLAFNGHRGVAVDERGDLVLRLKGGEVRQQKPLIYQVVDGSRRRIVGGYVVGSNDTVGFALGDYDRTRSLVIDPVISYSTYLGGSGIDAALGVAVDSEGSAYVTGSTTSIDFPLSAGPAPEGGKTCGSDDQCDAYSTPSGDPTEPPPYLPRPDAFVTKLSPDGSSVLYSSYLGGARDDRGLSVAVDSAGQAHVVGSTDSDRFPTTANAFDRTCGTDGTCNFRPTDTDPNTGTTRADGFLAKLSADGSTLLYSTFVGGSGDDTGRAGSIYYYASLTSPDPTDPEPGAEVEAVRGGGLFNGVHPGPAAAVALAPDGMVYMTGVTLSTDFRTTAAAFDQTCGTDGKCNKTRIEQGIGPRDDALLFLPDAFLIKVDTSKSVAEAQESLSYGTYLGGSQSDVGRGIAVARGETPKSTEVLISGAASSDFPVPQGSSPGVGGGFLVRFDTAAPPTSAVRYTRFFGNDVQLFGLAAGPSGAAFLTGSTKSSSFPATGGSFQPTKSTNPDRGSTATDQVDDAVVIRLNTTDAGAPPVYATYLGGFDNDSGRAIAVDPSGRAYVTGYTASLNFPVKDAIQSSPKRSDLTAECKNFTEPGAGIGPGSSDCRDAFFAVLEPDGSNLIASTYLRGKDLNPEGSSEDAGSAIATWADPTGPSHAIVVGRTGTKDFPTVGANQEQAAGYLDGFVTRISLVPPPTPLVRSVTPSTGTSAGATTVVIDGTALGSAGATSVDFGGVPASIVDISADGSRITALTPPGAGGVPITVSTRQGVSPRSTFARFSYFDGTWDVATDNRIKRDGHSATVLTGPNCGSACEKVLLVGGLQDPQATGTDADLYDPATGVSVQATCTPVTGVTCPVRGRGHTATLLDDGTILVVGGENSSATAQLYSPATGAWQNVGNPMRPRSAHTATLLRGTQDECGANCGKVLVVGGQVGRDGSLTAELYNPATKTWALTGSQVDARISQFTATLITGPRCAENCGKVLLVGGIANDTQARPQSSSSAELYDPKTGQWTKPTERRTDLVSRFGHTSTLLSTGTVLIAGGAIGPADGVDTTAQATASAELYDPGKPFSEAFSLVRDHMLTARSGHTAVALSDGRALIAGGSGVRTGASSSTAVREPLASAEVFDPKAADGQGRWQSAGTMAAARGVGPSPGGHTLSVVRSCGGTCERALVVGGGRNANANFTVAPYPALASVELYTPGPYISAVSPATGLPAGGDEVVIFGSGFVVGQMPEGSAPVTFGGVPARRFTVDPSQTRITAVTPPASKASIVEVAVVVQGLGRATSSFAYNEAASAVGDLVATPLSGKEVLLGFTAPGFPPAGEYVVKQSRAPLTEANFADAQAVCGGGVCQFTVRDYRQKLTLSVGGLAPETTYYYALKAKGSNGTLGPISNVATAITSTVTPGAVGDLLATVVNDGEVRLTFSAPGSNGAEGPPATRYVVKQATAPMPDAQSFEQATSLCDGGVCQLRPGTVGEGLSLSVGGLQRDTTYYYALRALDEAGNLGPISNVVSAAPGCVAPAAGPGRVVYGGGYRLVSLPEGTRVPAQSVLYSWFNLGRGGRYATQGADQPVASGRGYWAWFSCPRSVELGAGTGSASSPLTAFRASMVGNPSGTSPAVISGHDFTARWDPGASAGSGGYQVSGYRQNQTLAVGEGIWAFSYQDTTLALRAQ